ncbi:MAG: HDIG domain-containing metalloprotein [Chloroflexota bacterium]|nr:HDIG domain-containing protein [Chloroflexota bacterium]
MNSKPRTLTQLKAHSGQGHLGGGQVVPRPEKKVTQKHLNRFWEHWPFGKEKPPESFKLLAKILFAIICIITISFTLIWHFEDKTIYSQQVGEAAKDDIVAPKALTYVSQEQNQPSSEGTTNTPTTNRISIIKGQSIVRRGEILTPLQIEQLEQLGLRSIGSNLENSIATIGVVIALVTLMVAYFSLLHSPIWGNPRMIFFIGLTLIVTAGGMRLVVVNYAEHTIRPYLLPLAAISMVLAALLDVNLAFFFTAIIALLAGYVAQSPELAVVFFVGGSAGAFTLYKAERTSAFAYAGLAVAASQFTLSLCFNLVWHNLDLSNLGLLFIFNGGNGLVSTSLAFFIFSALGKLFGVTTVIQLLELAHPSQYLLRRLKREASGTYHHSMLVSNLAEQAAERLGGDALLARVGAYYHDIGKLGGPHNFIDNQGDGTNIHDTLDPRESIRLIKAHVEEGLVLAHQNHLPLKVVDIIQQHHGTCMISFFYGKALALGQDVNEVDFRYPGPKPQTKVAAIIMLSDGVEAAVRANIQSGRIPTGVKPTLQNPTANSNQKPVTIQEVVNKIIDERIQDGQLNECDLTLKDIDELRKLFANILIGIYHPRITYPEPTKLRMLVTEPEAKPPTIEANLPAREISLVSLNSQASGNPTEEREEITELEPAEVKPAISNRAFGSLPNPQPEPLPTPRPSSKVGIGGAGQLVGVNTHSSNLLREHLSREIESNGQDRHAS